MGVYYHFYNRTRQQENKLKICGNCCFVSKLESPDDILYYSQKVIQVNSWAETDVLCICPDYPGFAIYYYCQGKYITLPAEYPLEVNDDFDLVGDDNTIVTHPAKCVDRDDFRISYPTPPSGTCISKSFADYLRRSLLNMV